MGVSQDLRILKHLLQISQESQLNGRWQRDGRGILSADFNEGQNQVRVEILSVPSRIDTQTIVILSSPGLGEVCIKEPVPSISLRKKYDSPEETEIAETMKMLKKVAGDQHFKQVLHDEETVDERRQAIFQRLLGFNQAA